MNKDAIIDLAHGVEGCYVSTSKFKTSRISINMFVKLDEKTVSANALLVSLLTRSSKEYYNYTLLNARLSELYGAALYGSVSRLGDMQILKFVIAVLDDKYTLNNEQISAQAADLLLSMIFNPPLENGLFKQEDFDSEKRLLIENIKAEINEKRRYAILQTEKHLYKNEPCGVSALGTVEMVEKLSGQDVVDAWNSLLENAFVRVNVVSESKPDAVFSKIKDYFSSRSRSSAEKINMTVKHSFSGKVENINETMDVTQGKLCMAFSVDVGENLQQRVNAIVTADLFGGGPYSKLFANVREKQSLCYYCAARLNSQKGVILVDSGILEENHDKAYNGILEQLESIKNGDITNDDLNASKLSIIGSANTLSDSPSSLDSWYVTTAYDSFTMDEYIQAVNNVTLEDVIRTAGTAVLDTVYYLGSDSKQEA